MGNELQIINQQEVLGKHFKVYGTLENPLFKADDLSEWIEHSNTSVMLKSIEEDEKILHQIGTLNNSYSAWFLTEDGLYEVLMQSRKPIAKKFKKEVKKILKQIRITGGYIPTNETMTDEEIMARALQVAQKTIDRKNQLIVEQEKQLDIQAKEIDYKEYVIEGLVDKISLAEKRQILNRVVRYKGAQFQERWRELYKQFEMKYHIDLNRRLDGYNSNFRPKLKSKVDYIDKVMNKIPELYEIACKLYETDVKELAKNLYLLNEEVS